MACFLVPMAEAVVMTCVEKHVSGREKKEGVKTAQGRISLDRAAAEGRIPLSRKLGWLNKMLWGGSIMLVADHVLSGEIIPGPPFLSAMADPAAMLYEIGTAGVLMAALVTAAWGAGVLIADRRAGLRRAPRACGIPPDKA